MTYIFHNYIQTPQNTVKIRWEEGDICIFNNHRLIHTSTPWEIYKGQNRRFRICFLNSKKMYQKTDPVGDAASDVLSYNDANGGRKKW